MALLIWLNENVGFVLSAKLAIIFEKQLVFGIKCVTLRTEAEEGTGSSEEQPASNRLPHYTEIVSGTAIMHGCAFSYFRQCHIAKKT